MSQIIDYYESNNGTWQSVDSSTYSAIGQSFTGNGRTLSSASFVLDKYGSPTGTCYVKIYSHSGTYGTTSIGNSLLATSDGLNLSSISSKTFYNFTFSGGNQITLSSSTYYVAMVEFTGGDYNNSLRVWHSSSTGGHDGNLVRYHDAWGYFSTYDCSFYVYATEVSSVSSSVSLSPSTSPSFSISPSSTSSLSTSLSPSISVSLSPSISISASVSLSPSISISLSPSISVSLSPSISVSLSPSISESASPSPSASVSLSPSVSESVSESASLSWSASISLSPSPSPSGYFLGNINFKAPATFSREYVNQQVDYTAIEGKSLRDFSHRKEKFTLGFKNLTKGELDGMLEVVSRNVAVNFYFEVPTFLINTTVFPTIDSISYTTLGSDYRANLTLVLIEES